jgi:hypothetical protein
MAARRRTTTTARGSEIVVVNAGPPARASSGGAIRRRRSSGGGGKRRRRRGGGGGGSERSIQTRLQNVALGGFGYGLLIKHFGSQLPRLPVLGRSGTVALAVWFLKPKSKWIQDVGIAAAAIAGASFGETGTVSGDGDPSESVLTSDDD